MSKSPQTEQNRLRAFFNHLLSSTLQHTVMQEISFPYKGYSKQDFLEKALHWANSRSHLAYFNSNNIDYPYDGFKEILAIDTLKTLYPETGVNFNNLEKFHNEVTNDSNFNNWIFGFLGYDLKNELDKLKSDNSDYVDFPDIHFFTPRHLLFFQKNALTYQSSDNHLIDKILNSDTQKQENHFSIPAPSVSKSEYLNKVEKLRQHIEEGDCYEVNYCQEFHGQIEEFNPVELYSSLNNISPNPFSALLKLDEHFVISASPERFIKKSGKSVISQPIKGTRPRSEYPNEDIRLKTELRNDPKELAENMMIVDLVRNDLSRTAETGTVQVEEIFGIYSFRQVHQMISTITSQVQANTNPVEIIKNAFPMGSMTGAPKVKVMQLIEQYETTKRAGFSGAAGYMNGHSEFDFNVLIRSLFINRKTKRYSFQVGGAITYDSVPEKEYEECMTKAKALFELLGKEQQVTLP